MLRRILKDERTPRLLGASLEVDNFGSGIDVTLYSRRLRKEIESWTVDSVRIWDVSITEISPKGKTTYKSILPRFLSVTYDPEVDELTVVELEIGAVIPP